MAKKLDKVAFASLLISVLAASFSAYQWWRSEVEAKETAAILLSLKFLTDENTLNLRSKLNEHILSSVTGHEENINDNSMFYVYDLDYIANLLNKGQISEEFTSNLIKCDMVHFYDQLVVKKYWNRVSPYATDSAQLGKFYEANKHMNCN